MTENTGKGVSFYKATAIQFTSKYLNVFLQLLLTAILARLLSPEQYGVMAGITTFTSLFSILADMGLGPAIIQYKKLTKVDYGGLFVFSIILAVILSALFAVLSWPISWFFRDTSYRPLCLLATISIFFSSVNMVPNGLLLKDKQFLVIGIRLIVSTIIGGAVAIVLAMHGFGTAALIWNLNVTAIIIFVWNFVSTRKLISFRGIHMLASLYAVIRYSAYQAGFSLINYFSRNTDHLIIGRFFGSAPLGLYDKAYKLTTYPIQFVPGILGTVLQPYLSYYQNNKEKLFFYQMLLVRFLALSGSWMMVVFVLCSPDIVAIMYGPRWVSCVPLFTVLSCSIAFQMVMNVTGGILQSAGRTDLLFRQGLWATIIMLVLVFFGASFRNLALLTACVAVAFFFQMFTVAYYTAYKAFDHSMLDFLRPVIRIICVAALTGTPLLVCRYALHWYFQNPVVNLLVYGLTYTILFLGVFCMTGDMQRMYALLRKRTK